jgi:hypothetical protein
MLTRITLIAPGNITLRAIAEKAVEHRHDPAAAEGVSARPVELTKRKEPALTDDQIRAVAELVRRAGAVLRTTTGHRMGH